MRLCFPGACGGVGIRGSAQSVKLPCVPWLPWILLAVAVGVAGVAVLGLLTFRVLVHARELRRELECSQERLEPAFAAFEAASERRAERETAT